MTRSRAAAAALTLAAFSGWGFFFQESAPHRPNIIFFFVDDMGWQDTSVPFWTERTPFNDHYRTPHMERLAAQGVRFGQAYAAAVCSPSRTSLMTGWNPARHRVTQWTLFADKDQSGETERLRSPSNWRVEGLQPTDVNLAGLLKTAGYRTIHVGKAHWGANGTAGSNPLNFGFDVNIAGHAAGAPGSYQASDGFGAHKPEWAVPGLEKYHGTAANLTDVLTAEANAAVEQAVLDKKPFYLYLAHYTVHTPIEPHHPYDRAYRERGVDERESHYASMVEGMDASLGSVLAQLERLGVAEETIVLFASDNGGLSAHARGTTPRGTGKDTHNWPVRSGKGSAYEGGTRIPQIVSWARPDTHRPIQKRIPVSAGILRQTPTMVEDFFPTILGWAGVEIPRGHPVDGHDLTPLLTTEGDPDRPLLFHYPHVWGPQGPGYEPHSSLRLGRWKAIYFYQPQRWELYDLETDLGEVKDLSESDPGRLREMAERMVAELTRLGAQFPTVKASGEPESPLPVTR